MKNKRLIVGGIVSLIIVIALFVNLSSVDKVEYVQEVSNDDPVDISLDFYEKWLDAVQSTSTTPYKLGLAKASILSKTLSDRLVATSEDQEIDPVLCQSIVPTRISSKTIVTESDTTQILIMSKEPKQAGQATVILSRLNEGWYINDIVCSQGESDIPREFSFEHEGGLYSNEQPLDEQNPWNLFYIQDTQMHTAPLFFTTDSMCTDLTGNESVCDTSTFTDAKVMIQGEMTERGVDVKQLTFLQFI